MAAKRVVRSIQMICLSLLLNVFPLNAVSAKTIEVLDNIYTIVHGDGIDSNSTFIITKQGVIVIDTRTSPLEAKKVLDEIRKLTDLPILYTINTHYHGDHTFGNQVFIDSKAIIAQENVRRSLIGPHGQKHLDLFKTFGLPGLDEVTVTPPNMVYKKRMDIYQGGYHLQLLHRGRGHTDGDTFIYLQELRTVITGDLVFNEQIPYLADAYIDEWIDTLQYIENQDNELVVPGHGDVGGKPIIIAMKHFLIQLRSFVREELKKGSSLKETKERVRPRLLENYKDWSHLDRLDGAIERAFLEYSLKENI
ncbi:MAG: MBL fold metallo-hydrolase [Nitrospinaceae bacterium]